MFLFCLALHEINEHAPVEDETCVCSDPCLDDVEFAVPINAEQTIANKIPVAANGRQVLLLMGSLKTRPGQEANFFSVFGICRSRKENVFAGFWLWEPVREAQFHILEISLQFFHWNGGRPVFLFLILFLFPGRKRKRKWDPWLATPRLLCSS